METTILNSMCRCCASEGVYKDVKTTYTWMGEEEVYADMLREIFDISLSTSENGEDGGICEVCITQLRNAANFKKQVLHTEEQFKKHVNHKLFKPSIVKVETIMEDDNDSDDNNMSAEEGYSAPEYEVPIKQEEEPKPRKRAAAKATTSRAKKAKIDNGESSSKRVQDKVNIITTESKCTESAIKTKAGKAETESIKKDNTLEKHLHNLNEILKCSNATPILKKGGIGYMCSYCPEEYPKPEDLKKHSLREHRGQTNLKLPCFSGNRKSFYRHSVRLDITGLICALCDLNINSLEDLIVHIKQNHNKDIYLDINNYIIPFKFETEQLTCCLCAKTFERFKILQEHMNKHYRNYVCDICDAGFINQGSLNSHTRTHVKGTFTCNFCPKVFDTVIKKNMHNRNCHTRNMVYRCGYCHEGFKEYYMKERHLAKVHGVVNNIYNCNACNKFFFSSQNLKSHIKKDHLLERQHNCTICEMKFFRLHDLQRHMVKHSGDKKFQCEVCLKCYGRKQTLREHMRIHNDDRRFKCVNCGKTFVQKCSWKTHMKNRHGEIMK